MKTISNKYALNKPFEEAEALHKQKQIIFFR